MKGNADILTTINTITAAKMTTIYIGSSNVERFIGNLDSEIQNSLLMQKCTKLESFNVWMEGLRVTDRGVIISVIENFLCDEVNGATTKGDIEKAIDKTLQSFAKVVGETATKLPKTR